MRRRKQGVFLAFVGVTFAALVWPVYPLIPDVRPLVLGIPAALAWIVGWIILLFGSLGLLYRSESKEEDEER